MNLDEYINKMKKIQLHLLDFIDSKSCEEESYENLLKIFDEINLNTNQYYLKSLLYMLINISNNHEKNHPQFCS